MRTRLPAIARSAALTMALLAAACTAGAPTTSVNRTVPSGGASAGNHVTRSAAATSSSSMPTASPTAERPSPSATSGPTSSSMPAPPAALLAGAAGEPVAGDLGTFSWDGLVSDAPWIVGSARDSATAGAALAVRFDPTLAVFSWRARWATVAKGQPGTPVAGGSGGDPAINLAAPGDAGTWSLQLSVTFSPERSATWYWQIRVIP